MLLKTALHENLTVNKEPWSLISIIVKNKKKALNLNWFVFFCYRSWEQETRKYGDIKISFFFFLYDSGKMKTFPGKAI